MTDQRRNKSSKERLSWPETVLPPINLNVLMPAHQFYKEKIINPEGSKKRVLFVCAQGRLRSATAMHLTNRLFGYNTRCCGIDKDAIVPLTGNLCMWADEIIVMERYMLERVQECLDNHGIYTEPKCLDIPDEYDYMDDELCSLIQRGMFK